MRLRDLFDPKRGPETLVKLAMYPVIILVIFGAATELLCRISLVQMIFAFLFLALMSPFAYLIREARRRRPQSGGGRRGAERTPLLPPNEDVE